jgi:hypothetical protein
MSQRTDIVVYAVERIKKNNLCSMRFVVGLTNEKQIKPNCLSLSGKLINSNAKSWPDPEISGEFE